MAVIIVLPIMIIACLLLVHKVMDMMGSELNGTGVGVAIIMGAVLTPVFIMAFIPLLTVSIVLGLFYVINKMKESGEL